MAISRKKNVIRVLHVDDDPSILKISKLMLMDLENTFEFDSACCVDEAFKRLSTEHYDVIISDYEMPQKNGLQFLTELRKQNNEIPFILFTGKGREEVAIKALNLGADGYINKQGNPETVYGELAHSLRLLVDRSRNKLRIASDAVAFQNVENAIVTTDQTQTITSWNRAAENVFGYSANETVGKRIEEIFVPMQVDVSFQEVSRAIQDKGRFLGDVSYKNKKGELRHGELTIIVQIDNCGKISGSTIICHDITARKKNDLEINQKNEALERVAESIDSGLAVIGKDYRVVWANKRLKDLGVAPNKKCYQTFNNLKTVCPNCGAKKIFGQNINLDVHEFETVNSKGEKMWIELRCTPLKDKYGNVTATLELAVPITERKKKEQILRESEEKFRSLAEESPNMIFINCRGRVVYTNKKSEEIMGYRRAEFYSSDFNFLSLISPEYSETLKSAFAKHIKGETVPPYEYVLITKEGKKINAIINTSLVEYNGSSAILGIVTDITNRKKTEEALAKSEEKYRQLVDVAQEGIWAFDNNYSTVFANPRMAQMLGYSERELVGKNLREILFLPSNKKTKQLLTLHSDRSNKRVLEYKLKRKDGSWVYAGLVVSPFKDDTGNVVGTLALVSDITYSKVLERKVNDYSSHLKSMVDLRTVQLKDANERLVKSERLAAIGELAGMVGHDLRNPLAGIKNAAYFLKKRGNTISENQARETLEIIEKAIEHSDKIISDLLEYAREMHLELTESTIPTLVNAAIKMIAVPDRVQILNRVHDVTTIRVDTDKMMRIFINLIKNAIDAIPQRGTIEINSCRIKDCVKIAFTDTGIGIPEDTLPKIFTPLFTTKAQGMGFGLAICKRIIEAHGGTIGVETELNKGTTFAVSLPIKPKISVLKIN